MFKNLTFIVAAIALAFNSHGAEISGGGVNLSSPSAIGNVTPNTGNFTTLSASGQIITNNVDRAGNSTLSLGSVMGLYPNGNAAVLGSGITLSWSSTSSLISGMGDTILLRDAANTLALRNGTNAQNFRVYNTFTARGAGTTNLEALEIKALSNVFTIQSLKGSAGGTARDIAFVHGGTDTNSTITAGTTQLNISSGGVAIGGGSPIVKVSTATASLNFAISVANVAQDLTISLTGAVDGDIVVIGTLNAAAVAGTSYFAWVSASDVITVRFLPLVTGANPPDAVFRVDVIRH